MVLSRHLIYSKASGITPGRSPTGVLYQVFWQVYLLHTDGLCPNSTGRALPDGVLSDVGALLQVKGLPVCWMP